MERGTLNNLVFNYVENYEKMQDTVDELVNTIRILKVLCAEHKKMNKSLSDDNKHLKEVIKELQKELQDEQKEIRSHDKSRLLFY